MRKIRKKYRFRDIYTFCKIFKPAFYVGLDAVILYERHIPAFVIDKSDGCGQTVFKPAELRTCRLFLFSE